MNSLSLDIETLSTKFNAVILEIGIVRFTETNIVDTLVLYPSLDEQIDNGQIADDDTMEWWKRTNPEYLSKLLSIDRISIKDCHEQFVKFSSPYDKLWANSPAFDCVITNTMFQLAGLTSVTDFRRELCLRTYQHITGKNIPRNMADAHSTMADALHQAKFIQTLKG